MIIREPSGLADCLFSNRARIIYRWSSSEGRCKYKINFDWRVNEWVNLRDWSVECRRFEVGTTRNWYGHSYGSMRSKDWWECRTEVYDDGRGKGSLWSFRDDWCSHGNNSMFKRWGYTCDDETKGNGWAEGKWFHDKNLHTELSELTQADDVAATQISNRR